MKFPQYVSASERTVSVVGELDKKKKKGVYIDGKGYIDKSTDQIWIYSGSGKPKNANAYPFFWFNSDGEIEFSDPPELLLKAFNSENLQDLSLVNIIETTVPGEKLLDENAILDMNSAAAVFTPIFYESDDFLKKTVKTTILEKGIDINRLKSKTEEKYTVLNMASALKNATKMSGKYFLTWMELLGCDFQLIISNKDDETTDRLKYQLVYDSAKDKVFGITDTGQMIDLSSGTITEENKE